MDEITIRKGSIIHVEGIPFELKADIQVLGNAKNLALLIERTEPTARLTEALPR